MNKRINNIINKIAWFIPVRKWRDNFRNKIYDIQLDDKNVVDLSKRDFSLNSGERQTAQTLAGIRKDYSNILGYEAIYKLLNNYDFKTVLDIGS